MIRFAEILFAVGLATVPVTAQQATAPSATPMLTPPDIPAVLQTAPPTPAPAQTPPPGQGRGRGSAPTTTPPAAPGTPPPPAQGRGTVPTTTPPPGQNLLRPEAPSSWQNVKIDVQVMDSGTPEQQNRKSVSMLVLDGRAGSIRAQGHISAVINVDATPTIRPDGRIYLRVTFEYRVEPVGPNQNAPSINISESLYLVLPDGKPVVVSQAADPRSDRKVTVEITATVQK